MGAVRSIVSNSVPTSTFNLLGGRGLGERLGGRLCSLSCGGTDGQMNG
jgi:hypothetical protein